MDETIKLSRSTVEKYLNCPRCCVLDKKHKIKPPSLPFTLNIAVDNLCKNEFDYYRERQESHPLFLEHNIDAIPFKHKDIDTCLLYTSPSPRDLSTSRMPSSA